MALIAPAVVRVLPSYVEPGIILSYSQASQAYDMLPGGGPQNRLSEDDLYVYMKRADVRTRAAAGQASYNQLPGVMITLSEISTPTYKTRVRAEWDYTDAAAMNRWGMPIAEAYRLGMWQGHYQLARNALIYGFNPLQGEGILNTPGITSVTLPADSFGSTTLVTYDSGQLATFFLSILTAIKTRTNQFGVGNHFSIIGPQRILGTMEMVNIVQLTSYQRAGAGSVTTPELIQLIAAAQGNHIEWGYDDTLIAKGQGGTDLVIVVMKDLKVPKARQWNTNIWAQIKPGYDACTAMFCDRAAPTEIPTPLPGGATDVISEFRITSGWGIRPEAIEAISIPYS